MRGVKLSGLPSQLPNASSKEQKELSMKNPLDGKSAAPTSIPFTFAASSARKVSLAGDFNNWNPEDMPMYKGANGVWYLTVSLTPGTHEYRFIADGVWLDDPTAQQKITNPMGSENCVKIVAAQVVAGTAQRLSPAVS